VFISFVGCTVSVGAVVLFTVGNLTTVDCRVSLAVVRVVVAGCQVSVVGCWLLNVGVGCSLFFTLSVPSFVNPEVIFPFYLWSSKNLPSLVLLSMSWHQQHNFTNN
jgi:hypothetical protein